MDPLGTGALKIVAQVHEHILATAGAPLPEEIVALIEACARRSLHGLGAADLGVGLTYSLLGRRLVQLVIRDVQRCREHGCGTLWK
jgi:hypothetical protein